MQIEAALPIIRSLSDGVNPITGAAYPDNSPYAEPRILRALYAAVDLMAREVERKQHQPANFGKPWTEGEDRNLIAAFDAGLPLQEMARRHARTQSSIRLRLEKLGKIAPSMGDPSEPGHPRNPRSTM
jgi:hypothetical protein